MSQFDKLSFSSQLMWFVIFFIGAYLIFLKLVLPQIYVSIRVRERRMNKMRLENKKSELMLIIWAISYNKEIYEELVKESTNFIEKMLERKRLYSKVIKTTIYYTDMCEEENMVATIDKVSDIILKQNIMNIY
jgi:hypothetical protein